MSFIEKENQRLISSSFWLFIGWCFHYFPFFAMGRVLYFHHYFPAAIFSSMLTAVILDYLFNVIPVFTMNIIFGQTMPESIESCNANTRMILHFIYGTFLSGIAYSFYLFSPLAYGIVRLLTSAASASNSSTESATTTISTGTIISDDQISEHIDYSSEQQMKSLRWMDSWEF